MRLLDRLIQTFSDQIEANRFRLNVAVEWDIALTMVQIEPGAGVVPGVVFLLTCDSPLAGRPRLVVLSAIPNPQDLAEYVISGLVREGYENLDRLRSQAEDPGSPESGLGPSLIWP